MTYRCQVGSDPRPSDRVLLDKVLQAAVHVHRRFPLLKQKAATGLVLSDGQLGVHGSTNGSEKSDKLLGNNFVIGLVRDDSHYLYLGIITLISIP